MEKARGRRREAEVESGEEVGGPAAVWIGMGWISNSGIAEVVMGEGKFRSNLVPPMCAHGGCGCDSVGWEPRVPPSRRRGPRLFSDEAGLSTRATAGGLVDGCDGQGGPSI